MENKDKSQQSPITLRVTTDERSILETMMSEAGETNLSSFIRSKLFKNPDSTRYQELRAAIANLEADKRFLQQQLTNQQLIQALILQRPQPLLHRIRNWFGKPKIEQTEAAKSSE